MTQEDRVYHKKLGVKPGTVIYTGEYTEEKNIFISYKYNKDEYLEQMITSEDFELDTDDKYVNWYRFAGLNNPENFLRVSEKFGIPFLMQEDILHTKQRSKLEVIKTKSLTILPVPRLKNGQIIWQQISIFHEGNNIVTFAECLSPYFEMVLDRIKAHSGQVRNLKSDYLLYALIDAIVDQYINLSAYLINEVDELELELLSAKGRISRNFAQSIYNRKKDLLTILKRILQINDMISSLKSYFEDHDELDQAYLVDLEDHGNRIKDNLNHLRQMLTELMNQYLAINSDHMNEIMKTLTIFSAIFIPLGFIAGLYGMNFNGENSAYNMPELNFKYGYPTVLVVMAAFVSGLLLYFKKRKWL